MKLSISLGNYYRFAAALALCLAVYGFISFPSEISDAGQSAVELCANVIIPTLFPFFVLSSFAVQSGLAADAGRAFNFIMRPLFNVPGSCAPAFVLGLVAGYPVGAMTAIYLYEEGECEKQEAERLLSFCNNSGPAFILGTVGTGIFLDGRTGLLLYVAHIAASICAGFIFRFYTNGRDGHRRMQGGGTPQKDKPISEAFISAVTGGFGSVINICAFVIFFAAAVRVLFVLGAIPTLARFLGGIVPQVSVEGFESLLTGLLEVSSGVWSLKSIEGTIAARLAMAAFMLGWAGVSVHCQVLSFIGKSGLSVVPYIVGKSVQAGLSALFAFLLARVFPFDAPAAEYLARRIEAIASMDAQASLLSCIITVLSVWLFFVLAGRFLSWLDGRKSGQNRVKKAV